MTTRRITITVVIPDHDLTSLSWAIVPCAFGIIMYFSCECWGMYCGEVCCPGLNIGVWKSACKSSCSFRQQNESKNTFLMLSKMLVSYAERAVLVRSKGSSMHNVSQWFGSFLGLRAFLHSSIWRTPPVLTEMAYFSYLKTNQIT